MKLSDFFRNGLTGWICILCVFIILLFYRVFWWQLVILAGLVILISWVLTIKGREKWIKISQIPNFLEAVLSGDMQTVKHLQSDRNTKEITNLINREFKTRVNEIVEQRIQNAKPTVQFNNLIPGLKALLADDSQQAQTFLGIEAESANNLIKSYLKDKVEAQSKNENQFLQLIIGLKALLVKDLQQAQNIFGTELESINNLIDNYLKDKVEAYSKTKNELSFTDDQLRQVTIKLEDLVNSIFDSTRNIADANRFAAESHKIASENKEIVNSTLESISLIAKSSQKIIDIVDIIDMISSQTNLLGLNAALVATRAGEAGLSFKVVADEVRNLAHQAAESSKSTRKIIREIVENVISTESQVRHSTGAFNDLAEKSTKVKKLINEIHEATIHQSRGLETVHVELMQTTVSLRNKLNEATVHPGQELNPVSPELLSKRIYRIQMHWMPQAQFAGYYLAKELGYFSEAGLNIEIMDGGPGINPLFALTKGEIDFATAWLSSVIVLKSKGAELRQLTQIFQKSGLVMVALKESGLRSLEDFQKRVISSWGGVFSYPILALDQSKKLDLQHIYHGCDLEILQSGKADIVTAMNYNELLHFYDSGLVESDLTIIKLSDLGFGFPEDGLYTNPNFCKTDPEVCKLFTEATIRGWNELKNNQEEALDIVMEQHKRNLYPTNRSFQQRMMEKVTDMIFSSNQTVGSLNKNDFDKVVSNLRNINLIKNKLNFDDFFIK
jgi:NitT/TauT family transport system substrate-binding protein